jgi:putative transcriptional regulator
MRSMASAARGRDIGREILDGLRELKRRKVGRVRPLPAISDIRIRAGLSQAEFAGLLGVSVRTLQEWEQGRRAPSGAARTLLLIAMKNPRALLEVA